MSKYVFLGLALAVLMVSTAAIGRSTWKAFAPAGDTPADRKTSDSTKTVTGTVKEYQAGESIVVESADQGTQSFDLTSALVNVDPSVAVGSKVKVTETRDGNGRRTVTVEAMPSA
jgi:hypothetical protein